MSDNTLTGAGLVEAVALAIYDGSVLSPGAARAALRAAVAVRQVTARELRDAAHELNDLTADFIGLVEILRALAEVVEKPNAD